MDERKIPKLCTGLSVSEYDFAPFQLISQRAVDGVSTFQYSHSKDDVAKDGRMRGAEFMDTRSDRNQEHPISTPLNNKDMVAVNYRQDGKLHDTANFTYLGAGRRIRSVYKTYMGKTLEWNSFILAEEDTPLGTIDFGSFEAADLVFGSFQRNSLISDSELMRLMDYGVAANNGETYDLKAIGGLGNKSHYYRGSQIAKGIYVSMRDAGNMLAGMIAKRNGLSAERTYSLFGALQLSGNSRWSMLFKYAKARKKGFNGSYGELPISHAFQRRGYEMRFTH